MEQYKQPEQSEISYPSGWNVTTSRMVIEFYNSIINRTKSFFCLTSLYSLVRHVKFVDISPLPNSLAYIEEVSCRSDLSPRCVAAISRIVSRPSKIIDHSSAIADLSKPLITT